VPSLGASSVIRILIVVVLPAPFRPSRPNTATVRHHQVQVINSQQITETAGQIPGDDGAIRRCLVLPAFHEPSIRQAGQPGSGSNVAGSGGAVEQVGREEVAGQDCVGLGVQEL
jgi:hypothetical protein